MSTPQPVLPELRNNVVLPALLSDPDGAYTGFDIPPLGIKLPVPLLVQLKVLIVLLPLSAALPEFGHNEISLPAFTKGPGVKLMSMVSVTARQFPLPVDVRIIFTVAGSLLPKAYPLF